MKKIKIIIGSKYAIPNRYLQSLFNLMIDNYSETFGDYPPSINYFKRQWAVATPKGEEKNYLVAIDQNDEVIGYGYSSYNTKFDNLDKGYFWVFIKPKYRKQGFGKQCMNKLIASFPEKIKIIYSEAFENTDGILFLETIGMKKRYTELLSISDLSLFRKDEVKQEALQQKKKALEKGYEIIYFEDFDYATEIFLPDYIKMVEEIWNDMPIEDLSLEKESVPIERYVELKQFKFLQGKKIYTYIAKHIETGKIIGLTETQVSKFQPEVAGQMDTGILIDHRGNGLGLALKYQMLNKLLQDTDAKIWRTGNANSNEHMIRINRILKHKPTVKIGVFESKRKTLAI